VVAGVIAVLGLGASGAVAASAGQGPVQCKPGTVGNSAADKGDPAGKKGDTQDKAMGTDELAPLLAAELGVSLDKATAALQELLAHTDKGGGIEPTSPSFHAAADGLGITTQRLMEALDHVKQSLDPVGQSLDSVKKSAAPDAG
jgi:hypothetical protein